MSVRSGLEVLIRKNFEPLWRWAAGPSHIGVLCHQASVTADFQHIMDVFLRDGLAARPHAGRVRLRAFFGPQHGIWGHTQDNMIEWRGFIDERTGVPVYSLYGEHRQPTREMLEDLDVLVVDLQDVGARYYTYIWTLALCLEACAEHGVEVVVLDRPNPIAGHGVEGCVLQEAYRSFVGWHPLPICHGLTIGETARYFQSRFYPRCELRVIPLEGWDRSLDFEQTGLPWVMPSPNMPLVETARVYPGACLWEATNVSEGRGTTRPFEIMGAPWLDAWRFAHELNALDLPGVYFRPIEFQPTFNKYAGEKCGGVFIHPIDRDIFEPFLTGVAMLREVIRCHPDQFRWKQPPYEYEYEKLPFDILAGNGWLRPALEAARPLAEMKERWQEEVERFRPLWTEALLY